MTNKITEGVIWKQILIFFFPILIGSFFQQLYNTVDAIVVGRFIGSNALAAVGGSAAIIIACLVGFFVGVSSGAGITIAHFYGAKKHDETHRAVQTAFIAATCFGVLLLICGYFGSEKLLNIMGEPLEILPLSLKYMQIYFLGSIFQLVYNIGSSILTSIGDSKKPLYILITSMIINLVLDVVFVKNFSMGVAGVALATIIAQFCSMVIVVFILVKSKDIYRLNLQEFVFDNQIFKRIIVVGLPAGFQSLMYSLSNMAIQSSVNSFGTDTIAAYTAYGKIDAFFWTIMTAFGIAALTFAAQNYGARKYERVRKCVKVTLTIAFITTIILSIFLYVSAGYFYQMFTDNQVVIEIGLKMLRFLVPTYVTWVCIEILSNIIRATGDSLGPLVISMITICLFRIFWVKCMMPYHNEILFLMLSYPISWTISSLTYIVYYRYKVKDWPTVDLD